MNVIPGLADPRGLRGVMSGLVIGTELASVRTTWEDGSGGQLWSLADSALSVRYRQAALRLGWHTVHVVEHAAACGLWRTARTIGLIETPPPRTGPEETRSLPEEIKLPGESR